MSRRTQPCLTCEGRTRHGDQCCAACRRLPAALRPFRKYVHLTEWQQRLLEQTFAKGVDPIAAKGVDPIAAMRLQSNVDMVAWRALQHYALSIPRHQGHAFVVGDAS